MLRKDNKTFKEGLMLAGCIIFLFAGIVFGNGVPHFVKGMVGWKHQTPFGKPSSAVVNVIWGAVNWLGGFWLGVWGSTFGVPFPLAGTLAIAGLFLMGYFSAAVWQHDPVARGE